VKLPARPPEVEAPREVQEQAELVLIHGVALFAIHSTE
jgi:hypothetical protein